jgi:hypothetical protein
LKESESIIKRKSLDNFADNNDSSLYRSEPEFSPTANQISRPSSNINHTYQLKKMETSFNADFSDVSIVNNSTKATSLGAQAYTKDNEIHFAPGKYRPKTSQGQELLGHELTHVIQQRSQDIQPTSVKNGEKINNNFKLESEADKNGKAVAQGQKPSYKPISSNVSNVPQPIQAFGIADATDWLSETGTQVSDLGKSGAGWAQDKVGSVVEKTSGLAGNVLGSAKDKAVDAAGGAMDAIPAIKDFVSVACSAIEDIIENPVGFLKNIMDAVQNGFGSFFNNLTQHIVSGLTQWIFDAAQQAGVQFPAEFDLQGIISIVQQIINSVWAYVKDRILGNLTRIISGVGESARIVIEKVIDLAPTAILDAMKKFATKASKSVQKTTSSVIDNIT